VINGTCGFSGEDQFPIDERKPSRPRTQGASIALAIGATEDDGMRRFAAVERVLLLAGGTTCD
jgi:hypothetical protein